MDYKTIIGQVTPKGKTADVVMTPHRLSKLEYVLHSGETREVVQVKDWGDDNGLKWYTLSDSNFVREDFVTFTASN